MSNSTQTTVNIMGKEYLVACTEEEERDLIRSADFLDKKMREIRDSGKIIGTDRIAVMAALNIAHDLLNQQGSKNSSGQAITNRIRGLQSKIEDALYKSRQLEI